MAQIQERSQQAEAVIQQQQHQYQQQQHQYQQQQIQQLVQQEQNQQYALGLSPHQVLNQFHQLRPFGKGHYLSSFLKSVENALSLCGQNQDLIKYGITIVKNEKLIEKAAKSISMLPDDSSWAEIKQQLKKDFSPRKFYPEVFNNCRNVKISNLRELFNVFIESKFEINEIYIHDEQKPELYSPNNVDRDLTEILITKIDGQFRTCITEQTPNIESLFNKFLQLKLLDDTRAIDFRHRKKTNKIQTNKKFNGKRNESVESQNNFTNKPNSSNFNNKQNFNKFSTNSAQTKYVPRTQSKDTTVPMDIGNLENESEHEEVNFLRAPSSRDYP